MKNNKLFTYSKLILIILSIVTNITFLVSTLLTNFILFPILDMVANLMILVAYTILIFNTKSEYKNHLVNLFILNLMTFSSTFINVLCIAWASLEESILFLGSAVGVGIFPILLIKYAFSAILTSSESKEELTSKMLTYEPKNNFNKYFKCLLLTLSFVMNFMFIMIDLGYDGLLFNILSTIINPIICVIYLILIHYSDDNKNVKTGSVIVLSLFTFAVDVTFLVYFLVHDRDVSLAANLLGLCISVVYFITYTATTHSVSKNKQEEVSKNIGIILIKTKDSYVKIDALNEVFAYKEDVVMIKDITDLEIAGKDQYVEKSNIGEAILCGALFGGLGAAAGSIAGKRSKKVKWCEVYIKTSNPFVSVIYFKAKYEKAIKICNTIFLLAKENNLNIKE